MRTRLAAVVLMMLAVTLAGAASDRTSLSIIKEDHDYWAQLERNGVRYFTRDRAVLAEIEAVLEKSRDGSRDHAELGRQHAELGREHAALGREHARLGREHARLSRDAARDDGDSAEIERRRRDLEAEQRGLEAKQRELEQRQRDLEAEQRKLEAVDRAGEGDRNRRIEQIFERAVREGKAKKK
jgi:predicted RNase H-like nuclease (RuvC/YqgF family)